MPAYAGIQASRRPPCKEGNTFERAPAREGPNARAPQTAWTDGILMPRRRRAPGVPCKPGFGGPKCQLCAAGSYSAGGDASRPTPNCTACPTGLVTPLPASTSAQACSGARFLVAPAGVRPDTHRSRPNAFAWLASLVVRATIARTHARPSSVPAATDDRARARAQPTQRSVRPGLRRERHQRVQAVPGRVVLPRAQRHHPQAALCPLPGQQHHAVRRRRERRELLRCVLERGPPDLPLPLDKPPPCV
mgnify:CR=1 FL=1